MRAIHRRALHRSTINAPGISRRRYPRKKKEVPKEENTRPHAHHLIAEPKIVGHLEGSGPDVHPVQKSDHIQHKQEGQKTPRDAMSGAPADLGVRGGRIDVFCFWRRGNLFGHNPYLYWVRILCCNRSFCGDATPPPFTAEPKSLFAWALHPRGCAPLL